MEKHFKAIVENGYQILQTPSGERVNYLIETKITQTVEKVAVCVFSLNVNYKMSNGPQPFKYDHTTKKLSTPGGEVLEVEILKYSPETSVTVPIVTARCAVVFPYETNHEKAQKLQYA